MNPAMKRFNKKYLPIADAVALLDLDQEDREAVAGAVGEALRRKPDFRHDLFVLLASDPLVPCAGPPGDEGCPDEIVIRQRFHNSDAPDGRSAIWERRAPYGKVRCIRCGVRAMVGP